MRALAEGITEALPPQLASPYHVEYFCRDNDVRVGLDLDALRQEYRDGIAQIHHCEVLQCDDYRRVYAPWYRLGNQEVPFDHWLGEQWSFAQLGNPKHTLPESHREEIEALQEARLVPNRLRVLTLAVGKQKLVLDGNHRLAAYLREGNPDKTVYELRITAQPGTKIVPDVWRWNIQKRRHQEAMLVSLGGGALGMTELALAAAGHEYNDLGIASLAIVAVAKLWPTAATRIAQRAKTKKDFRTAA